MLQLLSTLCLLAIMSSAALASGSQPDSDPPAVAKKTPTPDEVVADLEAMCEANAEARAGRQAADPLFNRLGKEEKIQALTREVVRLHLKNEAIKHLLENRNGELIADRVARFIIAGTGGPAVYHGPSLAESHGYMKLTNADFVAAGGDVIQAMKNLEYDQNEIDEVVCTLVALRDQVVLAEEAGSLVEDGQGY